MQIKTVKEFVTEESAKEGCADRYEDDGLTTIDNVDDAINFLKDNGAIEASSSRFFFGGVWYTSESQPDVYTGEYESSSFFLIGFTEKQERTIFKYMTRRF